LSNSFEVILLHIVPFKVQSNAIIHPKKKRKKERKKLMSRYTMFKSEG